MFPSNKQQIVQSINMPNVVSIEKQPLTPLLNLSLIFLSNELCI